jgi:hypothetical protein
MAATAGHKTRYWDNANRIFHRKSFLFYVLGQALPNQAALQPTHVYRINPGADTGGLVNSAYRAVFLEGGGVGVPASANVDSVGATITPGTIAQATFPGIEITHANDAEAIEEVFVQYSIQTSDTHTIIQDNLAEAINAAVEGDPMPANCILRCTNPEANDQEIATGLQLYYTGAAPVGPDVLCAVATAENLVISALASIGVIGNQKEFGYAILDKPPTALTVNANGVPNIAGIRQFGFTRGFKANFSATEAEILSDQAIPKVASFLSAQGGNCSFELIQNDDAFILPVVSGTGTGTNNATRDFLLPASRTTQQSYALFMVTPNAIIDNAFDYLWLYRVKSAALDLARSLRSADAIPVTGSTDLFLNRSDPLGHYSIAYSV